MPFARIYQARIIGRIHGQVTNNVMHFGSNEALATDPAVLAALVELATSIIACAVAQLIPAASDDWLLERCEAKQIHPTVTDFVEVPAPAGSDGQSGAVNTSMDCVLVKIRTGGGGKRGRGRLFLPPPGDAHMTNSLLVAGATRDFYQGFLECMADKYIGAGATEPERLGVLSRRQLQLTPGDFDTAFREATSLAIDEIPTKLRSRKLRASG